MTRPYKRACLQTNFSKGGFVKKDFFSFFHFFLIFSSIFPWAFFSLHLLKPWGGHLVGPLAAGGSPANIGKIK